MLATHISNLIYNEEKKYNNKKQNEYLIIGNIWQDSIKLDYISLFNVFKSYLLI